MQALLLKFLKIGWSVLLDKLGKLAAYIYANWQSKKEIKKEVEELKQAGENPALTPEQKAKEIEDAFDNLVKPNKHS